MQIDEFIQRPLRPIATRIVDAIRKFNLKVFFFSNGVFFTPNENWKYIRQSASAVIDLNSHAHFQRLADRTFRISVQIELRRIVPLMYVCFFA